MSETRTAAPFVNNNREHLRDEFTQTLKKIAKEFKTPIVLEKNWFKKWRQEKQSQQTYRSAKILKKHFSLYAPPEQRHVIINKAL